MKIDLGEIFGSLLQQALPTIVQHVTHQLQGGGNQAQVHQPAQAANPFAQQQQVQQAQANPFGLGAPAQQPAQAQVTPEMIQALLTPLAQNEQIKAALMQAMQSVGVDALPNARPDQLPALYAAFKTVEQQAIQAGLIPNPATANGGGGLIV